MYILKSQQFKRYNLNRDIDGHTDGHTARHTAGQTDMIEIITYPHTRMVIMFPRDLLHCSFSRFHLEIRTCHPLYYYDITSNYRQI